MLSPYAFRPEESLGRRYPEPRHPYRDDFQRDRDRVVHSRAFRRLEDKTQVFTRRYSDHFRNRLTHTIEVSQVSRTIASILGLNEDLVEALALVHDVGHPPFGHAGERVLNIAMLARGSRFDHNLHALRIVEQFEQRYADFPGLNLTFEVREGIIKHSRDYAADEFPELKDYLLDLQPPLEAQLIDLTEIRDSVPVFARSFEEAAQLYPSAPEKLKFNEALKRVLDRLVSDLLESSRALIAASGVRSADDVRKHDRRLFAFSAEVDGERRQIKDFLYENVYYCPVLRQDKEQGEQIITELFTYFMETPTSLPESYQEKARHEPLHQIVCDYIAGMTDSYVQEQHRHFCSG